MGRPLLYFPRLRESQIPRISREGRRSRRGKPRISNNDPHSPSRKVIHKIAKRNRTTSTLTVEDLRAAAAPYLGDKIDSPTVETKFTTLELVKHSFDNMKSDHIKALFSTRRLAWSTSLVIFCYASLGLGYPLFNAFLGTFLAEKNANLGTLSLNQTYAAYSEYCGKSIKRPADLWCPSILLS